MTHSRLCGAIQLGSLAIVLFAMNAADAAESYIAQARANRSAAASVGTNLSSLKAASLLAAPIAVGRPSMPGPVAAPGANLSSVMQTGTNNFAAISQSGAGNIASVVQSGIGNRAVVSQR